MIGRRPDDWKISSCPMRPRSSTRGGVPLATPRCRMPSASASESYRRTYAIDHCRTPQVGLKQSRLDCTKLFGIRKRRNHDARRTIITLARAGGARKTSSSG